MSKNPMACERCGEPFMFGGVCPFCGCKQDEPNYPASEDENG